MSGFFIGFFGNYINYLPLGNTIKNNRQLDTEIFLVGAIGLEPTTPTMSK